MKWKKIITVRPNFCSCKKKTWKNSCTSLFFFQAFFLQLKKLHRFLYLWWYSKQRSKIYGKIQNFPEIKLFSCRAWKESCWVVQDEYCRFSSWANNFQRSLAQWTGVQSSHPPIKSLTKKCPGQAKCVSSSPKGPAGVQIFFSPAFLLPYNLKKGIQKPMELA